MPKEMSEAVRLRRLTPADEPKMVRFHRSLSEESVFLRYAGTLKLEARVAHARLARICSSDPDRDFVLVAERDQEIVAVARLARLPDGRAGEVALIVSDALQRRGLGQSLLQRLIAAAQEWRLEQLVAEVMPGNTPMRRLGSALGFLPRGSSTLVKDLAA